MKRIMLFPAIIFFSMIFMCSIDSHATSIETKIFYKDLKKIHDHLNKQQNIIIKIIYSLRDEDIKLIKQAYKALPSEVDSHKALKQIDNFEFIDLIKANDDLLYSSIRKVKCDIFKWASLMKEKSTLNLLNYDSLLHSYKIPEEDTDVVLTKYSNFVVDLLDKVQNLGEKANEKGLIGYAIPRQKNASGYIIEFDCYQFFLHKGDDQKWGSVNYFDSIYNHWKNPFFGKNQLKNALYSNKNILAVHNLWLKYIYDNKLTRKSKEDEEVLIEIEKINKRLAKLGNQPDIKNEKTSQKQDVQEKSTVKSKPPSKDKFKLDLPK
jgi:hypothetical protein